MADLRIVDAPVLLQESITDDVKIPTGGLGNFSVRLGDILWYVVTKEQLANKSYVDLSYNAVANDIKSLYANKVNKTDVISVAQGGTGASDAATARSNLGLGEIGGRNLLIQSRLQPGYLNAVTGLATSVGPDHHDPTYYPCVSGDKFIGKVTDLKGVTALGGAGYICFYDNNKTNIANYPITVNTINRVRTATAPANTAYYRVATVAKGIKDKIEKGNITTDWTPAPEDLMFDSSKPIAVSDIQSGQASYKKGWRKLTAMLPSQAGEITIAHGVTTVETVQAKVTNTDGIIIYNNDIDSTNQFYVRVNGANLILGVTANSTKVFGQSVTIYVGEEL